MHELIRVHSMEAGKVVKLEGGRNDLLDSLQMIKISLLTLMKYNAL